MMWRSLVVMVVLLSFAACGTLRHAADRTEAEPVAAGEWQPYDAARGAEVHRRLKPLERPQVRFDLDRAVLHGDSCWVVVRIGVPYRSVRRGECLTAQVVLHTRDGILELGEVSLDASRGSRRAEGIDIGSRAGKIDYLYMSVRFARDVRMETDADITVFAYISDGRYAFGYQPLTLPLFWSDDTEAEVLWPYSEGIPESALLETSPFSPRRTMP